jgi:hypothetical protein
MTDGSLIRAKMPQLNPSNSTGLEFFFAAWKMCASVFNSPEFEGIKNRKRLPGAK